MKLNIRFKYWMLAATATLVLALTGLFLAAVFGKFSRLAEDSAQERFALVTQRAVAEITRLVPVRIIKLENMKNFNSDTLYQLGELNGL